MTYQGYTLDSAYGRISLIHEGMRLYTYDGAHWIRALFDLQEARRFIDAGCPLDVGAQPYCWAKNAEMCPQPSASPGPSVPPFA